MPTEIYDRDGAAALAEPTAAAGLPQGPVREEPATGASEDRRVLVCRGANCVARGALGVWQRLKRETSRLEERGLLGRTRLTATSCLGPCENAPVVQVYPGGRCFGGPDSARLVHAVCEHLLPLAPRSVPAPGSSKRPHRKEGS
jgi:(2Fe-2S) ferredoxin